MIRTAKWPVVISLLITIALGLGLGLGIGLRSQKANRNNDQATETADYPLAKGEWSIIDAQLASYTGSCANNNLTYGDGGALWSLCGRTLDLNLEVSQYINSSYALAGNFPIDFDNALGFNASQMGTSYYYFPVNFISTSGNCDIEIQFLVSLGIHKEDFEIVQYSLNPMLCSVEGLSVPSGYDCRCAYRHPNDPIFDTVNDTP